MYKRQPQKRLDETLSGVVEDCVNAVGVDVNTASASLLGRVSGLNAATGGVMVFARSAAAASILSGQVRDHRFRNCLLYTSRCV